MHGINVFYNFLLFGAESQENMPNDSHLEARLLNTSTLASTSFFHPSESFCGITMADIISSILSFKRNFLHPVAGNLKIGIIVNAPVA